MLKCSLDTTEIGIGIDVGDQQDVYVGRAEMVGDVVIALENLGHETAKDDQDDFLVIELMKEPDQRTLGPGPRYG